MGVRGWVAAALAVVVAGAAVYLGTALLDAPERGEIRATLSAVEALAGEDTVGYARAEGPVPFDFPADHGPHPDYRTEWWYFTGNLAGEGGRRFGYQLTFFRNSLAPESAPRVSAWNTNQLWMAHLAVTDVEAGVHLHAERFGRGAVGLAGADSIPLRVWVGDWRLAETGEGDGSPFPLLLHAQEGDWGIELEVEGGKPPVLQGEAGWSRKGPEPGNASYYFSHTRMPTRGNIRLGGDAWEVEGDSWMDREWSTSALSEEHVGWDWFSLQLTREVEIMFFQLRREDGASDPLNHGVLVEPDGSYRSLEADDVTIEVLERWGSPLDGTEYPVAWRMRIPAEELDLRIRAPVVDQEMNLSVRYWEGAVDVEGERAGEVVGGVGFVEMTGYGG
ncbi:MAG: lipocalin-like domain-containing protein [Gemmatimonadota bacterium]